MSFANSFSFAKFERCLCHWKYANTKASLYHPYSQKQNYPGEKFLGVAIKWKLLLGHNMINGNIPWEI